MKHTLLAVLITFTTFCQPTYADEIPTISPTATFTTDEGEETATTISGSAPLTARFYANAENTGSWTAHYEWRFTMAEENDPYLIRYE